MRKRNSLTLIWATFIVFLLNGCIIDIPNVRPDGPSPDLYGKVVNSVTGLPIVNAVISDGFSTTITDNKGEYRLKAFPGASHVFISVPEFYEIPMKDGMPQIFELIDSSKDSVRINFSLTPLKNGIEKEFTLFAVADPQVLNSNDLRRLNNETIPDIQKERESHNNVYGVTLGDLAFDKLEVFGDIKKSFISSNIPFFHTIGNHDFSSNIYNPIEASRDYVSHFGPLDYSFNRGNVHIIIMNNVYNYGVSTDWGFSEEQINWLRSNLKHVSKDKMIVVCVHIPVLPSNSMERKSQFLEALSAYNEVHILSGHWHANRNYIRSDLNIYEHITGAASGLWWSGITNKCGAPNGYGVYEISGNKMKNWYYKSVNFDRDYQISMLSPNTFGDTEGYVIANVWNADENWDIELFEDGINKGKMEQFTGYAPDIFTLNKSKGMNENTGWYFRTNHLFRLKPSNNNANFLIRATDPFGNIYQQTGSIKSIESLKTY